MVLVLLLGCWPVFYGLGEVPVITMLAEDHWAPGFNEALAKLVSEWAKAKGVEARVDFIASRVAPSVMAAEAEARKGHDIVYLYRFDPALYKGSLVPLNDLAQQLEEALGPWREVGRYLCEINGIWYGIPFFTYTWAANINVKHWAAVGLSVDEVGKLTWDEFLSYAEKLQSMGTPVACAISADYDSDAFLYPLLWSFGGKLVDASGRIVADSAEVRAAFEYVRKLAKYMPKEIFGWGGADNNMLMLSGLCSWTINPPTIYATAKVKGLPIAEDISHVLPPKGPAGQFVATWDIALGIWSFSPHIDLAKDLILFLMKPQNYRILVEASTGCNQPYLEGLAAYCADFWAGIEPLRRLEPLAPTAYPFMWPAPPSSATAMAIELHLLPVAVAKYVTGEATLDQAIAWLVFQLERLGFSK
jgi:ABC-type glycerol-3-phosphate transport system substrate-binding protein